MCVNLKNRIQFDILTKDLPRATRILFRVSGSRRRKGGFSPLGWAAAPVFDFKGNVDTQVRIICLTSFDFES